VIAFFRFGAQVCARRFLSTFMPIPRLLATTFLGEPLAHWLAAAGIALATLVIALLAKRTVLGRVAQMARGTASEIDDLGVDLVRRTRSLLLVFPAVYLGSLALDAFPKSQSLLRSAAIVSLLLQIALWLSAAIDVWVASYRRRRLPVDAASATTVGVLRFVGKLTLWSLLLLLALDNLGVNVTALVTGLGVGVVAVALAVQSILGDLFASLSIVIDKPFVLGDTISAADVSGTVESIGLKTTRLRSPTGEQIVFANGDLLKGRIRNFQRMTERRVTLAFGISQSTPAAAVAEIPELVRSIVQGKPDVRFERAHLKGFGASILDFEASYLVLTPDFNTYMDRQQAIDLALLAALEERGIELGPSAGAMRLVGEPSAQEPPAKRRPQKV
jgi:small-conductance mechanosensitive channel